MRLRALIETGRCRGAAESCLVEVAAIRSILRDLHLLGENEVEVRAFPLAPVLGALARGFGPIARSRGIAIEISPSPDGVEVEGDPRATERVLSNLLDNAVKFSPDGKEIRVGARRSEGMILIEVEDRGIGIAGADHERIFEPFVRLDREKPGSGLGLAIARSLAEAQGGKLTVASAPGRGSCFVLALRPA